MTAGSPGTDGTPLDDGAPSGEDGSRPEAVARIANQRDQFKATAATLGQQMVTIDAAYQQFRGMEGFTGDPYAAAKAAATSGLAYDPNDADSFGEKLTGWWNQQRTMLGIPDAPPPAAPPPPTEVKVGARPPGSTGPSPAASGGTPPPDKLTWTSPEVQELYRKGDHDGIKKLISEGRFQPSPGNPAAHLAGR
jgi:hypothetical protein